MALHLLANAVERAEAGVVLRACTDRRPAGRTSLRVEIADARADLRATGESPGLAGREPNEGASGPKVGLVIADVRAGADGERRMHASR